MKTKKPREPRRPVKYQIIFRLAQYDPTLGDRGTSYRRISDEFKFTINASQIPVVRMLERLASVVGATLAPASYQRAKELQQIIYDHDPRHKIWKKLSDVYEVKTSWISDRYRRESKGPRSGRRKDNLGSDGKRSLRATRRDVQKHGRNNNVPEVSNHEDGSSTNAGSL